MRCQLELEAEGRARAQKEAEEEEEQLKEAHMQRLEDLKEELEKQLREFTQEEEERVNKLRQVCAKPSPDRALNTRSTRGQRCHMPLRNAAHSQHAQVWREYRACASERVCARMSCERVCRAPAPDPGAQGQ